MLIRNIMLHQGRDVRSPVRLEVACAMAAQHNAHITGVFVMPSASDLVNMEWAISIDSAEKWLSKLREGHDKAQKAFDARLSAEGLSGEWHTMEGKDAKAMMAAARHGDLTILGQTNPDEDPYDSSIPDDVLLGAGGPVLIIPYADTFSSVGKRIMVAWDGSREAARAVKDALPLMREADKVLVYCVVPAGGKASSGTEICAHLAKHGVEAELAHNALGTESDAVDSSLQTVGGFGFQELGAWTYSQHRAMGEINVGDALLSAAADHSIDLLVMGAYGHARLREMIFGGVTRHILKTMTVPVLMSN